MTVRRRILSSRLSFGEHFRSMDGLVHTAQWSCTSWCDPVMSRDVETSRSTAAATRVGSALLPGKLGALALQPHARVE